MYTFGIRFKDISHKKSVIKFPIGKKGKLNKCFMSEIYQNPFLLFYYHFYLLKLYLIIIYGNVLKGRKDSVQTARNEPSFGEF